MPSAFCFFIGYTILPFCFISAVLTFRFELECNGRRLFSVPSVSCFLGGNDDSLGVHLGQPFAQNGVQPEKQVPVVVAHDVDVRLISVHVAGVRGRPTTVLGGRHGKALTEAAGGQGFTFHLGGGLVFDLDVLPGGGVLFVGLGAVIFLGRLPAFFPAGTLASRRGL